MTRETFTFNNLHNFLFPKKCLGCGKKGTLFCNQCLAKLARANNTYTCQPGYFLNGSIVALNYQDHLVKKAILSAKYPPYLFSLIKKLCICLIETIKLSPVYDYWLKEKFVFVPIPLSPKKQAIRGFNQAILIGQELSRAINLPLETKILLKKKNTKSQAQLNFEQRKINIKNCFNVKSGLKNKKIILIDDLITSGATINEAARTLKQSGAQEIWAVALARPSGQERNLKNKTNPRVKKTREKH